jgi:hypothetical protein
LGVTPSAWNASYKGFQLGSGGAISGHTSTSLPWLIATSNAFINSSGDWTRINDGFATRYFARGDDGSQSWWTASNSTAGTTVTFTQAMTLDASGNRQIGTTSAVNSARDTIQFQSSSGGTGISLIDAQANNTACFAAFYSNTTQIGSITNNGNAAVLYNTTSDQRLKENIQDAASASALIDALQVRQYDWKADGNHQRYGFVAQELVTVAPEAVHQPADPEEMMAVDYSKLVPMLVKEIQSLRARLAALESI